MAEQETPPEGGKTLGLDRRQLLILGAAAAAGVLWFWWRSRSANQASTADTTSTTDTSSADTGAVTPYPVGGLTEQQLADLEASIAALHGPPSKPPTQGGGTPPIGGGGGTKPPVPVKTQQQWTKYVIQRGDTPAKISRRFGIPFKDIWSFNLGASSPHSAEGKRTLTNEGQDRLKTGQWLAIPKK